MFFDDLIISIGQFLTILLQRYGWKAIAIMIAIDILLYILNLSLPSPR